VQTYVPVKQHPGHHFGAYMLSSALNFMTIETINAESKKQNYAGIAANTHINLGKGATQLCS
jgi:hypothetical protein